MYLAIKGKQSNKCCCIMGHNIVWVSSEFPRSLHTYREIMNQVSWKYLGFILFCQTKNSGTTVVLRGKITLSVVLKQVTNHRTAVCTFWRGGEFLLQFHLMHSLLQELFRNNQCLVLWNVLSNLYSGLQINRSFSRKTWILLVPLGKPWTVHDSTAFG